MWSEKELESEAGQEPQGLLLPVRVKQEVRQTDPWSPGQCGSQGVCTSVILATAIPVTTNYSNNFKILIYTIFSV